MAYNVFPFEFLMSRITTRLRGGGNVLGLLRRNTHTRSQNPSEASVGYSIVCIRPCKPYICSPKVVSWARLGSMRIFTVLNVRSSLGPLSGASPFAVTAILYNSYCIRCKSIKVTLTGSAAPWLGLVDGLTSPGWTMLNFDAGALSVVSEQLF